MLVALWQSGLLGHSSLAASSDIWRPAVMSAGSMPAVHFIAHPRRLLAAATPPAGSGGYAAQQARFDPCQPIRYVVSGVPPFPGAGQLLTSAITEVSRVTGLLFVYAGTTDEAASTVRPAYEPSRYGKRWAPVLVAWTDPATVTALGGHVVGLGGASSVTRNGETSDVSGIVFLDAADLARMASRPNGPAEVRAVMLHELGHLVGLKHVADPSAIMYPRVSASVLDYSPGDLRGLAYAGGAACTHVN